MNIAEGSVGESRYYLIRARDLGYGEPANLAPLLEEVSRLLNSYARALLASVSSNPTCLVAALLLCGAGLATCGALEKPA